MRQAPKSGFYFTVAAFPLMGAGLFGPDVFRLSEKGKATAFFVCVALAFISLLIGTIKEIQGEAAESHKGRRLRSMIAIWGMLFSGLSFIGFAGMYFWPNQNHNVAASVHGKATSNDPNPPLTFAEIFAVDLQTSGGSFGFGFPVSIPDKSRSYNVLLRVLWDSNAQTKFLAMFIPSGPDAAEVCHWVYKNFQLILLRSNIINSTSATPGDSASVSSANFVFTKVLYFYTQEDLSIRDEAAIKADFLAQGITVHFRGLAYYANAAQNPKLVADALWIRDHQSARPPTQAPPIPPAGTSPQTSP